MSDTAECLEISLVLCGQECLEPRVELLAEPFCVSGLSLLFCSQTICLRFFIVLLPFLSREHR